jgi:tight adherence protein C
MTFWLTLAAGLAATLLAYLLTTARPASVATRFARYADDVVPEEAIAPGWWEDWRGRLVRAVAPVVSKALPSNYVDASRQRLRRAGLYRAAHLQAYLVAQAGTGGALALAGLVLGGRAGMLWATAGFAVGFMLPHLALAMLVRRRQDQINGALPDSIDLLTACVEAGLGLDAAIAQLTRRQSPQCRAFNQELTRYLQELQVGVARGEALRALGARPGVEDLRHVVTALVHGDALGVGVATILRAQAQHLRLRRKQRAEEKAMKAPIKILFPLLFGIFPSIFVIVLGPAALRLYDNFIGKFS